MRTTRRWSTARIGRAKHDVVSLRELVQVHTVPSIEDVYPYCLPLDAESPARVGEGGDVRDDVLGADDDLGATWIRVKQVEMSVGVMKGVVDLVNGGERIEKMQEEEGADDACDGLLANVNDSTDAELAIDAGAYPAVADMMA